MGDRNKEEDELIVGGDRQTTMNLEDNLGSHTPSSHKVEKLEQKDDITVINFPGMSLFETINFDDNSAELGYQSSYFE
ncbi:MAG TPA: hypothetical protein VIK86_09965 [Candidatus Paceibacterota bacterium]